MSDNPAASFTGIFRLRPFSWAFLGPVVTFVCGLLLLTDTAFWAGVLFLICGALSSRQNLSWVVAVAAALYMGHYQLVQDSLGDQGPFVMRNWMAVGFTTGLLIAGYGVHDVLVRRTLSHRSKWFFGAIAGLVILTVLTRSASSFLANDSPDEYFRVWLVTALTAAALALTGRFPVRVFLFATVLLAYADMLTLHRYVGTDLGTALSWTLSAGALACLILAGHRRWLLGLLVASPLLVGMVIASKQGPLLGTVLGLLSWWVMTGRSSADQRKRLGILGAAGGVAIVGATMLNVWASISDRVLASGLDVRWYLYQEAVSRIQQNPLLGQWELSPAIPAPMRFFPNATHQLLAYPHAVVLEVLLSWGLIGLGLWAVAQASAVAPAWRNGIFPLWLAGIIFASSSGDLAGNYTYWIAAGVAVGLTQTTRRRSPSVDRTKPVRI